MYIFYLYFSERFSSPGTSDSFFDDADFCNHRSVLYRYGGFKDLRIVLLLLDSRDLSDNFLETQE